SLLQGKSSAHRNIQVVHVGREPAAGFLRQIIQTTLCAHRRCLPVGFDHAGRLNVSSAAASHDVVKVVGSAGARCLYSASVDGVENNRGTIGEVNQVAHR